jgi:hypothetical protein
MKAIIFIALASIIRFSFVPNDIEPVEVEYFKNGQVLLPDYSCVDTLIVTNADELNKIVSYIEQRLIDDTDYTMDSIFHSHCKIK